MRLLIPLALITALSLMFLLAPASADVNVNSRFSWGFDSNVYESVRVDRRVSDGFIRAEVSADIKKTKRSSTGPKLALRLAGDRYNETNKDNRLLTFTKLSWRGGSSLRWIDLAWQNSLSRFEDSNQRNVTRNEFHGTGLHQLSAKWRYRWNLRAYLAHSPRWASSGRRGMIASADLIRSLGPSWRLSAGLGGGAIEFDHEAMSEPDDQSEAHPIGEKQLDDYILISAELTHTNVPYFRLSYGYRKVNSNNFGFSYDRHEGLMTGGTMLRGKVSLQIIGRWQKTVYSDSGFDRFLPGEDPEDQDLGARSGLTVQLRRPISSKVSLECQYVWQKNEVLASDQSYNKSRVTAGFTYRLH